jgi:hypothetical protein
MGDQFNLSQQLTALTLFWEFYLHSLGVGYGRFNS